MEVGEKIYSNKSGVTYTIFYAFKAGGQAEVAFATSSHSHEVFFIKRLLNIKHSTKSRYMQKQCEAFEAQRNEIYKKINSKTLDGATCPLVFDFFREGSFYYVVSKRIEGFSLSVSDVAKYLSLSQKLFLCRTIVYSFYPLESQGIIHGDIKPDNFILRQKNGRLVANMVDLESSFLVSSPPEKGYIIGTEPYYSPELVLYNDESNEVGKSVLSTKSDIFSLGVVFYEILTGKYPRLEGSESYAFEAVKTKATFPYPGTWPASLQNLLTQMMSYEAAKRPGVMQILAALKSIELEDKPISGVHPPYISVAPTPDGKSQVTLHTLQPDTHVIYSLEGAPYKKYERPFTINDDDLCLDLKVSLKDRPAEIKMFSHQVSASIKRSGKVARPTVYVISGTVRMLCSTAGADIYYTLNGEEPTKKSNRYRGTFTVSAGTPIRVVAFRKGMHKSEIVNINCSSTSKSS